MRSGLAGCGEGRFVRPAHWWREPEVANVSSFTQLKDGVRMRVTARPRRMRRSAVRCPEPTASPATNMAGSRDVWWRGAVRNIRDIRPADTPDSRNRHWDCKRVRGNHRTPARIRNRPAEYRPADPHNRNRRTGRDRIGHICQIGQIRKRRLQSRLRRRPSNLRRSLVWTRQPSPPEWMLRR